MFRSISLFLFLLFTISTFANNPIKGKVIDASTKEPLPYATVSATQNGTLIDGVITDDNGNFQLQLANGSYTLKIEFLSYETQEKTITVSGNLNIGVVELSEASQSLDEVVITAEKSTVALKIDKKVFNVGKDLLSQNGSLQQVLENVPSVSVGVNGTVSLRGNPNVRVLINGKPSVLSINNNLNQIPAEQIDRIEVITNPSSRYQAAGTAGIINVILKKNKRNGLSGSVNVSNAIRANTNINTSLNYKTKKLNLFSTLGYRFVDNRIEEKVVQNSLINTVPITLNRNTTEYRNSQIGSLYLGFDYSFSEKSVLTASYYKFLIERNNRLRYDFNYFDAAQNLDNAIARNEIYYEPMDHNQLEISYTKDFDKKGKKLTVDFQYDFWDDDENENFNTQTIFPILQEADISRTRDIESSKDFLLQLDFVNPLTKEATFETGFRGEARVISSDYKAEVFQNNQWEIFDNIDNKMDYHERILGVYALYSNKVKRLSYQLGLRTEYTNIEILDRNKQFSNNKEYTRFFPTIHLSYNFSESNSMQLGYSRRINRPSFWHLNPFSTLSGGLNAQTQGNPDLDPSYTNVLELSFLAKMGKLQINPSVYYQSTVDPFQFYTQRNANDVLISTTININNEKRYGTELSMTYRPNKWLQLSGEFNYYTFEQKGVFQNFNFDFNNNTWFTRISTRVNLPKQYTFQASYNYSAPTENAQTITKSMHVANLGFSKSLFNNKVSAIFNIGNLFDSRERRILSTGEGFSYQSNRKNLGPLYSFSLVYRFSQKENTRTRRPGQSNR